MLESIRSINPATDEELGVVPATSKKEVVAIVARARAEQPAWQAVGLAKRVEAIRPLVALLKEYEPELSEITSREMGRPIASCKDLNDYAVKQFTWNLDNAEACLKSEVTFEDDLTLNEVVCEPRGVVACIMAWNFPVLNFVYGAVQALIAGNSVILKYSEEIPFFSMTLEKICALANLPNGVLSFVYGDGQTGDVLTSQTLDLISFTGSSETGRKIHIKAAQKGIPVVLEMGGSSPGVVFADTDVQNYLQNIFDYRFDNSGQYCDNLKRLIVHKSLFDPCVEGLAKIAVQVKLGSSLDQNTDMGPLVAERQVVRLEAQVQDALDKGARLVCGGKRPSELKGAFYEPTILTDITKDMLVWYEEVFGPVLPIVSFETYDEAIALANDTPYGLTAYIFTKDQKIAAQATTDIKAGCIGVNGEDYFKPQNPFGGYKQSGLGRENGKWGFHDVCQIKTVARAK